ncbi:hypothetical protein FA13DRAFT_1743723 [Coprinellus micaceus]|uniref:Uncharacterized protein n=1 Tax=Coprinellus micaceus TaxID=71717 RepID=A0A4Y7SEE7_COPMI|nr:hypothetical protein FA13DRAFT_1743723 [Coprinellus micaceus]
MALLPWYLVLLSSTLASPVLAPPDVIGTTCTNVCLEHYPPPRLTTCLTTDTAPVFNTRYRSTIEIVWSCLAIIFASTWICVHPNVAGYKTTKWQRLWKRVKLFAVAVFAPELLAVFAFFQRKGCRMLHKRFRGVAKALNISLDLDDNSEVTPLQPIQLAILPFAKDGPKCNLCLRRAEAKYDNVVPTPGSWETIAHFAKHAFLAIKRALTWYYNQDNSEVGFKRSG